MIEYYELRCTLIELFYETLLEERSSIRQAASRGLVEFQRQVKTGDRDGLIVLSVLLSRVARHESAALKDYVPEVAALLGLAERATNWKALGAAAREQLKEDVLFVRKKAGL